jgi:hypothetical protein
VSTTGYMIELIATREGEEQELVARMRGERARAAAAALYSDERAMATVAKVERHLSREVERALTLLRGLQAARRDRDEQLGEVTDGVIELGDREREVLALAEGRGFGPALALMPSDRAVQAVGDEALEGGG